MKAKGLLDIRRQTKPWLNEGEVPLRKGFGEEFETPFSQKRGWFNWIEENRGRRLAPGG